MLMTRSTSTFTGAGGLALAGLLATLPLHANSLPSKPVGASSPATTTQSILQEGIQIEMQVLPHGGKGLREGEDAAFEFHIRDASGQPMSGAFPAAWMDLLPAGEERSHKACQSKLSNFISGSLLSQPELDLNVYHVLALNEDATISVVDPLFGFGGSKLLDMVVLEKPGDDWVLTEDQTRLFVSMPDAQGVAVVDTATWQVLTKLRFDGKPRRLALQGDGAYLWVAFEEGEESGVTAFHLPNLKRGATLPTGVGPHDLALSEDHRFLYVSNEQAGTVSVVDVRQLKKVAEVPTGDRPISVAWSPLAERLYVAHEGDGSIVALGGGESPEIEARMMAEPGLGALRFAPGGRFGFVPNPEADVVHIVDVAKNRIVQTGDMEAGPDQITFSDGLAYVRHRGSEIVLTIPLDQIGEEGRGVPVVDFPGGQLPPGQTAYPSLAEGIVQAPGANAVLVANPGDRVIYYYKEGMAAPMGSFKNYGRQPRAVQVVDRSLREREPGLYRTEARLRRPGRYDVAFFMDSPRVTHCFEVEVGSNPELAAARRRAQPLLVEAQEPPNHPQAGEPTRLRFVLRDPHTEEGVEGLEDVQVMAMRSPGAWHRRQWAEDLGGGVYEATFEMPEPGVYYAFVGCESKGLGLQQSRYLVMHVAASNTTETSSR